MTVVYPEGVPTAGNEKVTVAPTFADPQNPTITELTAADAVDVSCYLTRAGFNPTSEQGTGSDQRLCTVQTYESPGRVTYSFDDLVYVYDPQGVAGAADNVAYETLKEGFAGYVVDRRGLDYNTAYAADQKVWLWPVILGPQRLTPISDDEGDKFKITQKPFVVGERIQDATVTA